MAAPQWGSFAGVTVLVLGALVLLARASQAMLSGAESSAPTESDAVEETAVEEQVADQGAAGDGGTVRSASGGGPAGFDPGVASISTRALLVNVAASQGLFGAVLVAAAWLAAIPPSALGVSVGAAASVGLPAFGAGVALGVGLYGVNELGGKAADRFGIDYSEGLREQLAPDSFRGWVVLLAVVLPVIAGFEELLFRAALVGALSAGYGLSPWLLAVASSVAFAVGHGAQGPGGVLVTGALGFALAAAFVLTGSLLVVVVAHYLVNALEFVVHEGLGVDW